MITGEEALKLPQAQLSDRDEMVLYQRLRASIVETIKTQFTGVPFDIQLPSELASTRILYEIKRDFETAGWRVDISGYLDAGKLVGHKLDFAPVSTQPVKAEQKNSRKQKHSFLGSLYEELTALQSRVALPAPPLTPTLSVIFGTYNRIEHLKQAVESVRKSVGELSYEIVICDGGSKDGSREWLASQGDVILVGDRHLTGAVAAFNHCYRLARGEFIANLNDDCIVKGSALADGVAYLQTRSDVGQVAFGFRGDEEEWHVNDIYPRDRHPNVTWSTTYANFGVTRRLVADTVAEITGGFWNPIYKTYAADCELSAWIHKLGWRVVKLPHLHVVDTRIEDPLRVKNMEGSGIEAKRMYARWPAEAFKPNGLEPCVSEEEITRFRQACAGSLVRPKTPSDVLTSVVEMLKWPEPGEERRLRAMAPRIRALDPVEGQFPKRAATLSSERVLHVHINGVTADDQQRGLVRALQKLGSGDYSMVRWTDLAHDERQRAIIAEAAKLKPTLVFMQLQEREPDGSTVVDVETVREIRRVVGDPKLVIATWCGDIASHNSPWGADGKGNLDWQVGLGRVCDLTLHSSMSHVRVLRAAGCHNASYLQIGYDEEQYWLKEKSNPDFDVCFLASHYGGGDAFSCSMRRHDGELRDQVITAMIEAFGDRFGLYGRGFTPSRTFVPVSKSHEIYWQSKIGLHISLVNDFECYSSDRLHRILGCGCLLLTKRFVGMSTFGLKHGENCLIWETPDEAEALAKDILAEPDKLVTIATAGTALAHKHMTWDIRMLELGMYTEAIRAGVR